MKEKKFIIMISSILGVMLMLFMVFGLAAIFNTNLTESSNRSLEISIALFSMFATFGGAYLGAKIAGDNAKDLFEKDVKIRDIETHLKTNLDVLGKINDCKEKLVEIDQHLDEENFYYPSSFRNYKDNIESVYNCFKEIDEKDINEASLIINIEFDELHKLTQKIYDVEYIIDNEKYREFLENYNRSLPYNSVKGKWHEQSNGESKKVIYIDLKGVSPDKNEGISIELIYKKNFKSFEKIKRELQITINQWLKQYEGMEFKTKEDIYRIYKEVRM